MSKPTLSEMKNKLYAFEETRLKQRYPDDDAWRAPHSIADSMGCVGIAMYQLQDYASMLQHLPEDQLIELYETTVPE